MGLEEDRPQQPLSPQHQQPSYQYQQQQQQYNTYNSAPPAGIIQPTYGVPSYQQQQQQQPQYGYDINPNQPVSYNYNNNQQSSDKQHLLSHPSIPQQPMMTPIIAPQQQQYVYHETCEKFPEGPIYKDLGFTVLFLVHLVSLLVILIVSVSKSVLPQYRYYNTYNNVYNFSFSNLTILLVTSGFISFIYILVWMKLAVNHARPLLLYTYLLQLGFLVVGTILSFVLINIYLGIVMIFVTIINVLFFIAWRKRIDFTASLLSTTSQLLNNFPAAFRLGFYSLGINVLWLFFWGSIVSRVYLVYEGGVYYFLMIYLVFSFYWVINVIKNVVHVTVSGLVATWYFMSGTVGIPRNPTLKAFNRAVTTSFGSICLGSLLISIIQTLRFCADMMQGSNNGIVKIFGFILGCILSLMEGLLRFFNAYAFTQVSIYGKSYCESVKDTASLFSARGADLIVNDNFIGVCLGVSAFLGGLLGAMVGLIVSTIGFATFYAAIIAFFASMTFVLIAMEVIYSGVITVFVCFMMEPHILQQTQPALYNLYVSTYNKLVV
eukprot:gene1430-1804_t